MDGNRRVLVVEDEPMIAMMIEDFLEAMDMTVVGVADTVGDALRMVEAGGFDCAILDVNLRDSERSDPVAAELAARGIPFVMSSGAPDGSAGAFSGRPVLMKPFTMKQMEEVIGSF